jgi:hypothetical protein
MHHRRHAGVAQNPSERDRMILMRMHAAGRHEPDQVAGAAALLELFDQAGQRRRTFDLAARDRVADARQVLHDDAARANVEMPDLGIAHLPVGQADVAARRAQKCVRSRRPQAVEARGLGLTDGVVRHFLAPTPAIQHDKHNGAALLHG